MLPKLRKLIPPLASLGLLIGCAQTEKPALIANDDLCRSWRHQTISKGDQLTDRTAEQIEGGNKARPAWGCEYGANRAKGKGNG